MHPLILIVIVILLYVYVSYYYRFPSSVKILNAFENSFNTSLMLEKQPIVILDVPDETTLHLFKGNVAPYLLTKNYVYRQSVWHSCRAKYMFIKTEQETEIHLLPATKKLTIENAPADYETLITLQIKPSQIIILPFKWHYYCDTPLQILGVNDYISWLIL